jgi:hypothetical protein
MCASHKDSTALAARRAVLMHTFDLQLEGGCTPHWLATHDSVASRDCQGPEVTYTPPMRDASVTAWPLLQQAAGRHSQCCMQACQPKPATKHAMKCTAHVMAKTWSPPCFLSCPTLYEKGFETPNPQRVLAANPTCYTEAPSPPALHVPAGYPACCTVACAAQ